jgi:hypothetical protein
MALSRACIPILLQFSCNLEDTYSAFFVEKWRGCWKKCPTFIVSVYQVFLAVFSRYPLLSSATKIWHGLRLGFYRGHCVSPWQPLHWQGKWLSSSAHTGSAKCGCSPACMKCRFLLLFHRETLGYTELLSIIFRQYRQPFNIVCVLYSYSVM